MATDPAEEEEWHVPEENEPGPDLSREDAAFERERPRLVRDHLGKFALVRFDEVIGVFNTPDEAIVEGVRRFGLFKRMIVRPITERDEVEYIANVDITHPSFKPLN
jgi:hypothetical protein